MSLRVAIHGRGEDLIMLHGLGANHHVWSGVRKRLNDRYRTIAPDLPGFGKSAPAGAGFELEQVAEALWRGLEGELTGPSHLLGNSLGGAVALTMAAQRPELVRSLVLAAPAGFNPRERRVAIVASGLAGPVLTVRRVLGRRAVTSRTARRLVLAGAVADASSVDPEVARAMIEAPSSATRLRAAVYTAARCDLSAVLTGIAAPVGVIWGERDGVVPISALQRLAGARSDALVEILPGAAHVPQVDQPQRYTEALLRLIDTSLPPGSAI